MSATPVPSDLMLARRDEFGLMPMHCFRAYLFGRSIGYAEGYAKGRADLADESWSLACQIVRGAAQSVDIMAARAKPYTTPAWAGERA